MMARRKCFNARPDRRRWAWRVTDINWFKDKNPDLAIKLNDVINRYLVAQINKLALSLGSAGSGLTSQQ